MEDVFYRALRYVGERLAEHRHIEAEVNIIFEDDEPDPESKSEVRPA